MRPLSLLLCVAGAVAISLLLGAAIVMVTPLRTLLPGYLKQSERSATEDNIMRLDSILAIYERNQNYYDNVFRAMNTDRIETDSASATPNIMELSPDSLLPSSPAERKFVSDMEERERYNISVLAPLAADGMMFSPVCDSAIFLSSSRNSERGLVVMPAGEAVRCVADGSVLATYYSPSEKGYVVLVQHDKGFVTRCAALGTPMVSAGDAVMAGQMIALGPQPDRSGRRIAEVRMWHNGLALIPFKYIGNMDLFSHKEAAFEDPRGR